MARACAANLALAGGGGGGRPPLALGLGLGLGRRELLLLLESYRAVEVPDEVLARFNATDEGRDLGALLFRGEITREEMKFFVCRWWKVMTERKQEVEEDSEEEVREAKEAWGRSIDGGDTGGGEGEDGEGASEKREPGRVKVYGDESTQRKAAREGEIFPGGRRPLSTADLAMDELPPLLPLPDMPPGLDRFPG